MKIGLQTWGSHGDIRPFIALAEGLRSAGNEVTLAITSIDSDRYDASLSRSGVRIRQVASPVIADREALKRTEERIFRESDPVKQVQTIIESLFLPAEAAMYEAAVQLCEENDLVIGHFFHYPLQTAAEHVGRPYASVQLVHSAIPSGAQPPAGVPHLGAFGNRLVWALVKSVMNRKLKKYPDRLRAMLGMKPALDLMEQVWASQALTLVAVSPQICARSSDWPTHYQVCGFLDAQDVAIEGEAPEDLLAFVSRGEPPVYMTFGSVVAGADQGATIGLLGEAANKAGVRAIIQAPDWQPLGLKSTEAIHYVSAVPHAAIFPQCRMIVHHGGAGTVQSALLAGKPSVVVAHTSEQQFWGKELARIGVAPKALSRRKLTADQLGNSISQVLKANDYEDQARKLGMAMKNENGVVTAVRLIQEKFSEEGSEVK